MDLNYTPQELMFRDELRAWLESHLPDEQQTRAASKSEDPWVRFNFYRDWQRKLHQGGWTGVHWPKEYGGRGATLMEQVIFIEEMARAQAPQVAGVLGLMLIGPTIVHHGTPDQKQRFLNRILSGEEIWCQGFSEPNAGSDLANLRTEAKDMGDHFLVNGHKVWNSYGWAADWCALVTRTDPEAPKHKGLSYLLVDMKSPGVEVRPLLQITGETEFCEIYFNNVQVPKENVLGRVNDGWNVAISTLMHERATLGADMQIVFARQLKRLVELTRKISRGGKPLYDDPLVRQKIGQAYTEIEMLRLNQMRSVSRIAQTGAPGPEGSILKICWSELNQRFQQSAQEILGLYGQLEHGKHAIDDGAWSYGFLRTRGNTIEAGTSEIQRNIIGHFVLGLPKSY